MRRMSLYFSGSLEDAKWLRDELNGAIEIVDEHLADVDARITMKSNDALCDENFDIDVKIEY